MQNPEILQHGRAKLNFVSSVGIARGKAKYRSLADIKDALARADITLDDDRAARTRQIEGLLGGLRSYQDYVALHNWHLDETTKVAVGAFEENREQLAAALAQSAQGDSRIFTNELDVPDYWKHDFHATTGGYDGHDYMGYIHGELIHKLVVEAAYGGGIYQQRVNAAGQARRKDYRRILDMGCGTGYYTLALAEQFPEAEITGTDISLRMLEYAQRQANALGYAWQLHQVLNEDTGFADESFDLVTSYILLHELPRAAMEATFAEAYRLLEKGGEMMMCDVIRLDLMEPVAQWQQLDDATREIEPHWLESTSLDLGELARAAGFIDVKSYGMGENNYPWIVSGVKG